MPELAGSIGAPGPTREEPASQACPPTGVANAVRLALWRRASRSPEARALHHMRQAAGDFRARGPPTRPPQSVAHAKSPAPIPLEGLRQLILGPTSAMETRAPGRKMSF